MTEKLLLGHEFESWNTSAEDSCRAWLPCGQPRAAHYAPAAPDTVETEAEKWERLASVLGGSVTSRTQTCCSITDGGGDYILLWPQSRDRILAAIDAAKAEAETQRQRAEKAELNATHFKQSRDHDYKAYKAAADDRDALRAENTALRRVAEAARVFAECAPFIRAAEMDDPGRVPCFVNTEPAKALRDALAALDASEKP